MQTDRQMMTALLWVFTRYKNTQHTQTIDHTLGSVDMSTNFGGHRRVLMTWTCLPPMLRSTEMNSFGMINTAYRDLLIRRLNICKVMRLNNLYQFKDAERPYHKKQDCPHCRPLS